jgi:glycine cleavage system H protein
MSRNVPADLLYTKEDEWIRVEGDEAVIGITDYAQDSLSDIVYLELPSVGDSFETGATFGVVESVKAASDLFMPVTGEVTAVNDELTGSPEQINEDPYGVSWMVRVRLSNPAELDELLDAAAYEALIASRE